MMHFVVVVVVVIVLQRQAQVSAGSLYCVGIFWQLRLSLENTWTRNAQRKRHSFHISHLTLTRQFSMLPGPFACL